jgi:O-antigen ligase
VSAGGRLDVRALADRDAAFRAALLAAASLLALLAVVSPKAPLYVVVGIVLLAIAMTNLVALLAVFVVLTFPEQFPLGLGTAVQAKPLGALLVLAWLMHMSRHPDARVLMRDHPVFTGIGALFLIFATASAVWAASSGVALSNAERLLQVLILLVIVYSAVRTRKDMFVICATYAFTGGATAAYAIVNGATVGGRLTGGIGNSNFLAAEWVSASVIAGFLLAVTHRPLLRALLVASIAVEGIAVVMTQSRSGVLALCASLAVAVVVAGRHRPNALLCLLLVGVIGAGYYGVAASTAVRDRITHLSEQNSAGRSDEWKIAVQIFEAHPIAGGGLGNYSVLAPGYATANQPLSAARYAINGFVTHNTYLQVLSELGVIGFALLLVLTGVGFGISLEGLRDLDADPFLRPIGASVVAATAGVLVSYIFNSGLYEKQLWLLLALVVTLTGAGRLPTGRADGD